MKAAVIAALAALAVVLGPHMLAMVAFTVALAVVLILAQRIDAVTMRTGWGLVPCGRRRSA